MRVFLLFGERAVGFEAYVEQEIAASGAGMDEDAEEILDGFVVFVGGLGPARAVPRVMLASQAPGRGGSGDVLLGGFDGSRG